jgi:LAO/AO transport system kinase
LQGIKKGIMEMADAIVITKADHDNILPAQKAKSEYQAALHLFEPAPSGWTPKVITSSAIANTGIDEVWAMIGSYLEKTLMNGYLNKNRGEQDVEWFHAQLSWYFNNRIIEKLISLEKIKAIEKKIKQKLTSPIYACEEIVSEMTKKISH